MRFQTGDFKWTISNGGRPLPFSPKIEIEKDKPQKLPSPRFRVATTGGRGLRGGG